MNQMQQLKVFVSERLQAAASEIFGAFEKTVIDYEEQACRLKEDNDRHRSLLDIILKTKLPQTEADQGKKSILAAATADPGASDSNPTSKARETSFQPNDLLCVFTSRTDFIKFAGNGNCPYCIKRIQATEKHLMRRHYLFAVHFTEGGTEKFVVPCTCKDRIKGRSHWHCPYCTKIIFRKCNFEGHLSKQHGYAIHQGQDPEMDQPSISVFEEEVPLCPEPWCQQEHGSLNQADHQASLLLQVKEEQEQEMRRQVRHQEVEYTHQLLIKGEHIQKANCQVGDCLEADHGEDSALNVICVDSYIQDLSEIDSTESGKRRSLLNSSTETLETQPGTGVTEIREPAGESLHITEGAANAENRSISKTEAWKKNHPGLKVLNSKGKKKCVKRALPPMSLNIQKSTKLSVSQNHAGTYCCKACGKTFHYMYTLRSHVQTHTGDNIHICGICGKHLEDTKSLVQHLQNHTKRNKCGICGKQFSNISRLKRHRRFHRPKGLNVMLSA